MYFYTPFQTLWQFCNAWYTNNACDACGKIKNFLNVPISGTTFSSTFSYTVRSPCLYPPWSRKSLQIVFRNYIWLQWVGGVENSKKLDSSSEFPILIHIELYNYEISTSLIQINFKFKFAKVLIHFDRNCPNLFQSVSHW